MTEPTVTFTSKKTYSTLNPEALGNDETITVLFALHGMGYLSKFFVKYFEGLDPQKNYVVAPQAHSKYYQDKKFKYVGASWLTRETIELEKENVYAYLDAVWAVERIKWSGKNIRLVLMGYSQGVSIITRWMTRQQLSCDVLLLHSGAIPTELSTQDFDFLPENTMVTYLYGTRDEYINEARKTEQQILGSNLFGKRLEVVSFDGIHEVNTEYLVSLSRKLLSPS